METVINNIEFNGKKYNMVFAYKKRFFKYYSTVRFIKANSTISALERLADILVDFNKNYKNHSQSYRKPKVTDFDLQLAEAIYKES